MLILEVLGEKIQKCYVMYIKLFVLHLFPATGVRNYLKEALVNIITVHAEVRSHLSCIFIHTQPCDNLLISVSLQVFTVSKDLVPRVLSKIVESVADEMCRLMQCVSTFSKNGALQVQCNTHAHTKATRGAVLYSFYDTDSEVDPQPCGGDLPVILTVVKTCPSPLQARLELCALRDAIATYLTPESK